MVQEGNITYADSNGIAQFYLHGVLGNQGGEIADPVDAYTASFGFSRDLGTIQATQGPIVWAVGYTTDPAINYPVKYGSPLMNARSPYYKLQYADNEKLVTL
jgi:hypothetical protein